MKNKSIHHWQKRIFLLCWGVYACAYLCRINLSVAIPVSEGNTAFNKTNLGLIGSIFFWTYAFGQLINGRLGDKFDARKFIFVGLLVSSTANIFFGFTRSFYIMATLWALNGYFQSTLWGPLMKTLANWFSQKQRQRMGLGIFTTVVVGYVLAWGGLGQMAPFTGWEGVFWIPGVIMLIYSFFWFGWAKNYPHEVGLQLESEEPVLAIEYVNTEHNSFVKTVVKSKLWLVALSGIPLGIIREGISLWGPMMLYETFQLNLRSALGMALLIPIFNLMGIIAARLLITRFPCKETSVVTLMFATGVFACAMLYFFRSSNIIICLLLLSCCSSSLYGATSILTSVIPQNYYMTSSVAGFLDFSIYLGAGISGIVTGVLSQKYGWSIVVFIWILAGAAGIVAMMFSKQEDRSVGKTGSINLSGYSDI